MTEQIKIGDGGCYGFNGDRYPFTVVEVISDKKVRIQDDDYKVIQKDTQYIEGPLECEFSRNTQYPTRVVTKRKNGRWVEQGQKMRTGWSYGFGQRMYSRNPHF